MRIRWFLGLVLLLGCGHALCADVLYNVTDLGGLTNVLYYTQAGAINDAGQMTGVSNGHVFLFTRGSMRDLGTPNPDDRGGLTVGNSINNLGEVTGEYDYDNIHHTVLYSKGQMLDLGALGGAESFGYGINDEGQVTGWFRTLSNEVH